MEEMNSFTTLADYIPDAVAETLNRQARDYIEKLTMPFGKYKGEDIVNVPLSYLDNTVSTMPCTWFASAIRGYVASVMLCAINEGIVTDAKVPNRSGWAIFLEIEAMRRTDSETLPTEN